MSHSLLLSHRIHKNNSEHYQHSLSYLSVRSKLLIYQQFENPQQESHSSNLANLLIPAPLTAQFLSSAVKVLERLLLPHLKESLITHPTQHGFKPMHSTTSSLLKLSTKIAIGFNKQLPPARTLAAAIDFSKAFDCIPHNLLLTKISNSPLHNNIIRWLAAYLHGRMASCSYNFSFSKSHMVHTGVPQGSVISPILFNFFLYDLPQHDDPNDSCEADKDTYADDALSSHSSHLILISEGHVNSDLDSIST